MGKESLPRERIEVVLLEGIHASATDNFLASGYTNVTNVKQALSGSRLHDAVRTAHIVGIRSRTVIDSAVFEAAERLIAVGCFCIGTNQVDLEQALGRGIPVFNAPYSNTRSVAEMVIAEAILLLRDLPRKNALAHRGVWNKSAANSYEIRGKKMGIIGYGNIGSQVSVLAESLGMRVFFHDVVDKLSLGNAKQVATLGDLLRESDIVSLHVPANESTVHLIGRNELQRMKPSSVLINASRGKVVDLDGLADALREGELLGAAIDVFPAEPKSNDEPFESPLREFDNCVLTPHVGGSTMEAQANIGVEVSNKLITYSDNGSTISSVNFPEVSLPGHPQKHRILHIHKNVPGVLSAINSVFSSQHVNISGQYLQTNDRVGYVVTDVDASYDSLDLEALRAIDGTIRTRILF